MGGNMQKGKQNGADGKKGENQQLIEVKEKDLKQNANLGQARWFFNTQYLNWELYNLLSEEKKKETVFWTIFPLEISNEIERAYINKFPYEKLGKMIFFDFLQQKHVILCNKDNSLAIILHFSKVNSSSVIGFPSNQSNIKKFLSPIECINSPFISYADMHLIPFDLAMFDTFSVKIIFFLPSFLDITSGFRSFKA